MLYFDHSKYGPKHYDSSKNWPGGALRSRARIELKLFFRQTYSLPELLLPYDIGIMLIQIEISFKLPIRKYQVR